MLQRPPCADCPPDPGTPRPEPAVRVSFGAPVASGTDVSLPLHIRGADRLGAAMLTLAAPLDRYDLKSVDGPASGGWITLHEEGQGRLVLGLLAGKSEAVDLTLRLALKAGEAARGEVAAMSGAVCGRARAML